MWINWLTSASNQLHFGQIARIKIRGKGVATALEIVHFISGRNVGRPKLKKKTPILR